MNRSETQHKIELNEIQPLLTLLSLPVSRVTLSDRPDCIIGDYNGKSIGIEVMECRPSTIESRGRNSKAHANHLVYLACKAIENRLLAEGHNHTMVTLSPTEKAYQVDRTITKKQFIDCIVRDFERHQKNDPYEKNRRLLPMDDFIKMVCSGAFRYQYVQSVTFTDIRPHSTRVFPISCYIVKSIRDDQILCAVRHKEAKLACYKQLPQNKNIAEYWLVLNLPIEEEYDFEHYKSDGKIESIFERIYLTQRDEIVRIK